MNQQTYDNIVRSYDNLVRFLGIRRTTRQHGINHCHDEDVRFLGNQRPPDRRTPRQHGKVRNVELEDLKQQFRGFYAADIGHIYKSLGLEKAKKELLLLSNNPHQSTYKVRLLMKPRPEKKECIICCENYSSEKECIICCENYSSEYFVKCLNKHEFCKKCIGRIGEIALSETGVVKCMNENCQETFSLDLFEEPLRSKLSRKQLLSAINSMKDAEMCQFCDYAELVNPPTEDNKIFICKNCNRTHCRLCKVPWLEKHMDKTCQQVQETSKKELLVEEEMTKTITRECPKCKVLLVKSGGCNKIRCSCGTIVCYVCRNKISGYQHFCNCPDNQCFCNKCKLMSDTFADDLKKIDKIKKGRNIGVERHLLLRDSPF